jgi:WD40 repeat protein
VQHGLMLALHRSGRTAESLATYQTYRARLADELGLEPGRALAELEHRILTNDPILTAGGRRDVAGYELTERLDDDAGAGRFGSLWRGRQLSLDRDVAVRKIESPIADDPEFVRWFAAELQRIARLDHPNIVPVHDYWREPGAAYVVTRLIQGETLRQRFGEGRLDRDDVLAICRHVGNAIATAHAGGITHGCITEDTIIVDRAGRWWLTDFERALLDLVAAGSRSDRDPAGDIGDFLLVLDQVLDSPGIDDARAEEARNTIRALRTDGFQSRPGPIADIVEAVIDALGHDPAVQPAFAGIDPSPAVGNPYRGLRAFDEHDAALFHGRDRFVAAVTDRLRRQRLVTVVGASGSGKSSLVRAGVVPAVRTDGLDGVVPYVTVMIPGAEPVDHLLSALRHIAVHDLDPSAVAEMEPTAIVSTVAGLLPEGPSIVVVDQFEELFVLPSAEARQRFLQLLTALIDSDEVDIRVLATLRADFWDRPLRLDTVGQHLADGAVHLTTMGPDELESVIRKPAESVGCELEAGLVGRLIEDASRRPGALPLLQYTLTELYQHRSGTMLTNQGYDESGRLTGSIAAVAERIHGRLTDGERSAVRHLFGRLAHSDGSVETRRRIGLNQLREYDIDDVVAELVQSRLLTFDADPISREPTVEIAHEALLESWDRLREWLTDDRIHRQRRQDLEAAAHRWHSGGRIDADLLRGIRLASAIELTQAEPVELSNVENEFLDASRHREALRQAEERRQIRRLRLALGTTVAVLAIALISGSLAAVQWRRASDASAVALSAQASAETRRMVADVASATESSSELGLLLAAEAHRREPGPITLGGLQRALLRTGPFLGLLGAGESYIGVEWAPDGERVYGLRPTGLDMFTVADGSAQKLIDANATGGLAVSDDGRLVAAGTGFGIHIVDISGRQPPTVLPVDGDVAALDFDADSRRLVSGDRDGWIQVWDLATGSAVAGPRHAHPEQHGSDLPPELAFPDAARHEPLSLKVGVNDVRFTPDGSSIVTSGGRFVRTFDATTLRSVGEVTLDRPAITGGERVPAIPTDIEFIDDTTAVVAAAQVVQLIDLNDGNVVHEYRPGSIPGSLPDQFDLDLAGDRLVTTLRYGELVVLDARSGRVLSSFDSGSEGRPTSGLDIAVSPDDRRAAVAAGGGVQLVSLDGSSLISRTTPRPDWGRLVQVDDTGERLVWATFDRTPRFESFASAKPGSNTYIDVPIDDLFFGSFNTFGAPVVLQRAPGGLSILHELDSETLRPTGRHVGPLGVWSGAVSPDGRWLAVGSNAPAPGAVMLVDRATFTTFDEWRIPDSTEWGVQALSWHPDGRRLAAVFARPDQESFTVVFDRTTGEVVSPRISQSGTIEAVGFTPDGRLLLTSDLTGRVVVRNASTYQPTGIELSVGSSGVGSEYGHGFQFSDDGRYMLSTIAEPHLLDTETWQTIGDPFPHETGIRLGAPDGARYLPTADGDLTRIWEIDPD